MNEIFSDKSWMRQCPKDPKLSSQAEKIQYKSPKCISSSNVGKCAENQAIFLRFVLLTPSRAQTQF
jgi:hypothetical protein